MKYFVKMRVDARFIAEVDADSIEEAEKKAEKAFSEADFGEASDIDGKIVAIEDDSGKFVYES